MDINPQTTKPISDDPELAKVLAGVNQQTDEALQFDTPPTVPTPPVTPPSNQPTGAPADDQTTPSTTDTAAPSDEPVPAPEVSETPETNPYEATPLPEPEMSTPIPSPTSPSVSPSTGDLSSIKKDALNDLRPLVGKLDIAPEEKFDTYLLLIRSTDDKTLIEPAYAAAQAIVDESRKAQALLDVIKEIDYLSNPQS